MISRSNRVAASLALACLLVFLTTALVVQARSPGDPSGETFQDDYPFPEETFDSYYPYPEATETTSGPVQPDFPPNETATPEDTFTPEVDLFGTEDAQMQGAFSTQAASATPFPSITPINTQTQPAQATITPIPANLVNEGKSGFRLNWGYFWIGFAIPVLAACGAILYLLDRRPDLFTPRPKS